MAEFGHLWAVAYDDVEQAERLRKVVTGLGWERHDLILGDVALVIRHADGSYTLDREPFSGVGNVLGCSTVGFLAGLVVGAPIIGAAIGAVIGGAGSAAYAAEAGIPADFIQKVQSLLMPGTSALFVLDADGDMDVILAALQGLGGIVLQTNVDPERARLIQSTLAKPATIPMPRSTGDVSANSQSQ